MLGDRGFQIRLLQLGDHLPFGNFVTNVGQQPQFDVCGVACLPDECGQSGREEISPLWRARLRCGTKRCAAVTHSGRTAREPLLAKGQAAKREGPGAIVVAATLADGRRNARKAFGAVAWFPATRDPTRFYWKTLETIVVGAAARVAAGYARLRCPARTAISGFAGPRDLPRPRHAPSGRKWLPAITCSRSRPTSDGATATPTNIVNQERRLV